MKYEYVIVTRIYDREICEFFDIIIKIAVHCYNSFNVRLTGYFRINASLCKIRSHSKLRQITNKSHQPINHRFRRSVPLITTNTHRFPLPERTFFSLSETKIIPDDLGET